MGSVSNQNCYKGFRFKERVEKHCTTEGLIYNTKHALKLVTICLKAGWFVFSKHTLLISFSDKFYTHGNLATTIPNHSLRFRRIPVIPITVQMSSWVRSTPSQWVAEV